MPKAESDFPPKWFDLEYYKAHTADADLNFWASAIFQRHLYKVDLDEFVKGGASQADFHAKWETLARRLLKLIAFDYKPFLSDANKAETLRSVSNPSMGLLLVIWEQIRHQEALKALSEGADSYPLEKYISTFAKPISELFHPPANPTHFSRALVEVDLSASDKKLMADFKTWVAESKRTQPDLSRRTFSEADLKKWHSNMLLPYIDLILWEHLHHHHYTFAEIEEALFPNEVVILPSKTGHAIKRLVLPQTPPG